MCRSGRSRAGCAWACSRWAESSARRCGMADIGSAALSCDDVRDLAAGFVLGALEPAEMAGVRNHLTTCPEAHAEVESLGAAVPALAAAVPLSRPSPDLGSRIMAAARAEA